MELNLYEDENILKAKYVRPNNVVNARMQITNEEDK
jgi:hypothetical protein